MSIETLTTRIKPLDLESMAIARAHQDTLTKPQGSRLAWESFLSKLPGSPANQNLNCDIK